MGDNSTEEFEMNSDDRRMGVIASPIKLTPQQRRIEQKVETGGSGYTDLQKAANDNLRKQIADRQAREEAKPKLSALQRSILKAQEKKINEL